MDHIEIEVKYFFIVYVGIRGNGGKILRSKKRLVRQVANWSSSRGCQAGRDGIKYRLAEASGTQFLAVASCCYIEPMAGFTAVGLTCSL